MNNKLSYKIRISDNPQKINLPISEDFLPVDNSELVDEIANRITQREINNIEDWEKTRYCITCSGVDNSCFTMNFNFFLDNGSSTDEWVGGGMFLNEDVQNKTQRFLGSFFRISYYTTPNRETQKLVSYSNIPLIDQTSAYVKICDDGPGGLLYFWKSQEKLNINRNRLYMKVEFFNSADGSVYLFGSGSVLGGVFPISKYSEKMDYVPILLDPKTRTFEVDYTKYYYNSGLQEVIVTNPEVGCNLTINMKKIGVV